MFAKNMIISCVKFVFFEVIVKDYFIHKNINLYFYETQNINFLTSTLLSSYIVRNLKINHTLNRIIYPLMRHLSYSQYILYQGWKIGCFGRFQRRGRASKIWYGKIRVPLNTISANIDFHSRTIRLRNGICNIKVYIARKYIFVYNI
jgi:ribosomal protein S3